MCQSAAVCPVQIKGRVKQLKGELNVSLNRTNNN